MLMSDDGPVTGRATQRRRIALLALLGAAGERGVSRDRLMALLWPEADADRARHLLSDSAYRVNQALGGDAIIAIGDALALNAERVTTDLGDFDSADAADDWEAAVALYGGPLLDGFHVSDSAELERWIESERVRVAGRYARALEQLADDRERSGDVLGAVDAARALAAQDPLSARYALRYMRALDAAGERASAVRHARVYAALVEQDLGVEPDAEVAALAERLSSAPPAERAPASVVPAVAVAVDSRPASVVPAVAAANDSKRASPAPDESSLPAPEGIRTPRGSDSRFPIRSHHLLIVALVLAVILLAVWAGTRAWGAAGDASRTIAVLPFADLSPQGGHAYLSDGITEELIATLSRVPGLRVAARTSSFAFKDKPADVREVGARLGVETVLEGSVRTSGNALRVTAQLVSVRDGYPFWSETYERRLDDAFAIQDEIARQIVGRLRPAVPEAAAAVAPPAESIDPEAYDLYLKGRYAWHQRTRAGLLQAARLMEDAVSRAPRYARGLAGLGEAYAVLGFYDYLPPAEAFPKAAEAAGRALALDSGLASPHATLAYVALYHDWDFVTSEREFQRAIANDSGYSTAHQWYGNLLTAAGRFDEAERAMRRAMELDPLSLIANAALGWVHYYAGEPRRAIAQLDRTLELDPRFELAQLWKGQAYLLIARHDSGRALIEGVVRSSGRSTLALTALAYVHAAAGDVREARELLAEVEARAGADYVPSYEIARVYAALDDRDRALDWLERAARERSHSIAFLTVDPALAPLRGDPRFEALVRLRRP